MIFDPLSSYRETLYFLGLLANMLFGARFLLQWINSEKKGMSIIDGYFWTISLIASLILALHSMIQLQFTPTLLQLINVLIAYRNLDLEKQNPLSSRTFLLLLLGSFPLAALPFILQGYFLFDGHFIWARTPVFIFNTNAEEVSLAWDILGFIGYCLFTSRFWIQCYYAEVKRQSSIGPSFWWMSLSGALLMILYFGRLNDLVNLIGPAIGLVPYIRNLMLLRKQKKSLYES